MTILAREEESLHFTPTPEEMAEGLGLLYHRIPEWLRMGELAELLGLSHQSVYQAYRNETLVVYTDPEWEESAGGTGGPQGRYRYAIRRDDAIRWAYYRGTEGINAGHPFTRSPPVPRSPYSGSKRGRPPRPGSKAAQHTLTQEGRMAWEAVLKRRRKKRRRS